MPEIRDIQHQILFKDPFSYCAHAHIADLGDGEWVAVFNRAVRRPVILHPPNDPQYYNVLTRSTDAGRTWNTPRVAPGYDWHGTECAGLTVLHDGTLLLNQWRFTWYPLETARKLAHKVALSFPTDWVQALKAMGELPTNDAIPDDPAEFVPWARGDGGTFVHRSTDGGRTWDETIPIDTTPFSGGYGMRGGVQLANGDLLLPLSDVPNYRTVFVVRSSDGGRTWAAPVVAAAEAGKEFEEPSLLALDDQRLIMLLRENTTHFLHQCTSTDGGHTWHGLRPTPILGYPPHLLRLPDGRLLCTYGYRYVPYGIRAVLSVDEGRTWDVDHPLMLRADLPNRDLGYPASLLMRDGRIFTIYYGQDTDGVTCIQATSYTIEG